MSWRRNAAPERKRSESDECAVDLDLEPGEPLLDQQPLAGQLAGRAVHPSCLGCLSMAPAPSRRGPLLALQGEAILIGARDAAPVGNVLGGLAHVPTLEGTPQAIVNHRIDHSLVAEFPAVASAEQ